LDQVSLAGRGGEYLLVSAPRVRLGDGTEEKGMVFVYRRESSVGHFHYKLGYFQAADADDLRFGSAVALSSDLAWAAVGQNDIDNGKGAAVSFFPVSDLLVPSISGIDPIPHIPFPSFYNTTLPDGIFAGKRATYNNKQYTKHITYHNKDKKIQVI
jgi:hypothetical protein